MRKRRLTTSRPDKHSCSFIMRFTGGESDREFFNARLNGVKETEVLVYPDPTPAEKWVYSRACSIDLVVNSVIVIVSVAGSLAAIAQCVHEFLKDRSKKADKADRQIIGLGFDKATRVPSGIYEALSPAKSHVLIKADSTEIEVTGEFSKKDILDVLREAAKMTTHGRAFAWLQMKRDMLRKEAIELELRTIGNALPEYARIVGGFERKLDELGPDQLKSYRKYKTRMKRLQERAKLLRKELKTVREVTRER